MKKYRNKIVLIIIILILIIIGTSFKLKNKDSNCVRAIVLEVLENKIQKEIDIPDAYMGSQVLKLKITSGKFKGKEIVVNNSKINGDLVYDVIAKKGMRLVLLMKEMNGEIDSILVDNYSRENAIYLLGFILVISLLIIGRMKGLMALISLVLTGVLLIYVVLPLIFKGYNPMNLVSLLVIVVTITTLFLIGGINQKSIVAIIGTIVGVLSAGTISLIFGKLAHLTGITGEASEQLIYIIGDHPLNIKGIMFAGIIIASLGAVMDVGMSIASTLFEINRRIPDISKKELFASGMNVGKDIMGTMANTLILAFTGSSLSLMILLMAYKVPYLRVINLNMVSTEIIQGLSGTIGLVLTVPITSFIGTLVIKKEKKSIH